MELDKSLANFIKDQVALFEYKDFSPENSKEISEIFKKIFYKNSPYWKVNSNDINTGNFCIELKKYGENRKAILLGFQAGTPGISKLLFNMAFYFIKTTYHLCPINLLKQITAKCEITVLI